MAEESRELVVPQGNEFIDPIIYDGTAKTKDLPKASLKGVRLDVTAVVTPTWASGTPVARPGGLVSSLIESIEIRDARGNLVDVKPRDLRFQSKRYTGKDSPALIEKNSTDLTNSASVGFFEYPATSGQPVAVAESIWIPFECELAEANFLDTLLSYNGKDINTIKLNFNKIHNLQKEGGSVDVSYVHDIKIDVDCSTTNNVGLARRWKRWSTDRKFHAPTQKSVIDLKSVESLMGMKIEITKGISETPITLEEAKKIKFDLFLKTGASNTTYRENQSLFALMMNDLNKKKMDSITAGVGYMNLLSGNMLESALKNAFDDFQLRVTLDSSLNFVAADYFNVRVVIDEVE